jgi:multidrug efflux pump
VVETLVEAIVLVFLVMFLFLQNFRATVITTMTVPVVLLGTFGILAAAGFSINTLTMFGMVLAIGLLVDDAIVVVENVERVMARKACRPRKPPRNPWARSRAPWSVSPWCCRRYCCRWRSSAAPPV